MPASCMTRSALARCGALLLAPAVLASCADVLSSPPAEIDAQQSVVSLGREPLGPLPAAASVDGRLADLGRRLFHDKRLSADETVACASCHDLATGGDDGRARSVGIGGRVGAINAPGVYNSALNFAQFWDGRAATLEEQIDGPITNPLEMGSTWPQVIARLEQGDYPRSFAALFPDGITAANVRTAIAAFERTLLSRGSAFDRWLAGDAAAITADQKSGYELFKAVGCIACHQGVNVGGNMFQRFGVLGDYFADRGQVTDADFGRFNVTRDEADRFVFRVPSLRNVEKTSPYFHDGSAATLGDAVQVMAEYQLGRALDDGQVSMIVSFLGTLSGDAVARE